MQFLFLLKPPLSPQQLYFLSSYLQGRIWFWGFVVFFFILGVLGSCVFCCCRDDGSENNYGHNQYAALDHGL
jgi:hypothetical protein